MLIGKQICRDPLPTRLTGKNCFLYGVSLSVSIASSRHKDIHFSQGDTKAYDLIDKQIDDRLVQLAVEFLGSKRIVRHKRTSFYEIRGCGFGGWLGIHFDAAEE